MSTPRRGGLGKGLAALLPQEPTSPGDATQDPLHGQRTEAPGVDGPVDSAIGNRRVTLAEVALTDIVGNPRQPREVFDDDELQGLATSLLDVGMLQPLVVRPRTAAQGPSYELVAGERRLRAAALAGLETVPVVVRHTEDADLLKEALVENIHRVQLNPLEEAAAYQQLLDEFGFSQEELARRLGKSRPVISNTLRLMGLPPGVQRRVAAGVLSAGHAKALLALDDTTVAERIAERIVAEGLSVRATEELVRLRLVEPSDGPAARTSGRSTNRVHAPGLVDLQHDLSDALRTKVRITMGARRGRIQIDFLSVEDLERIVAVIANGLDDGSGLGRANAPGTAADVTPSDG